mmetsp:Transcript_21561/g.55991  ORF Transcript_21561/g.55991 Transcript_21561/m.55991 type:complete len:353 (-) Transcript_21561:114-1172(-)
MAQLLGAAREKIFLKSQRQRRLSKMWDGRGDLQSSLETSLFGANRVGGKEGKRGGGPTSTNSEGRPPHEGTSRPTSAAVGEGGNSRSETASAAPAPARVPPSSHPSPSPFTARQRHTTDGQPQSSARPASAAPVSNTPERAEGGEWRRRGVSGHASHLPSAAESSKKDGEKVEGSHATSQRKHFTDDDMEDIVRRRKEERESELAKAGQMGTTKRFKEMFQSNTASVQKQRQRLDEYRQNEKEKQAQQDRSLEAAKNAQTVVERWSRRHSYAGVRRLLAKLTDVLSFPAAVSAVEGITTESKPNDVRKAYMKLIRHIHPDKIEHTDVDEAEKARAVAVFQVLKPAFDKFRSK